MDLVKVFPPFTEDVFMKYRDINKEFPEDLVKLTAKTGRPKIASSNWRKVDTRFKGNWLANKKLNKDDNEKLYSAMKGLLNKLSKDNFDQLVDEIMTLNITCEDHLMELTNIIFTKALVEQAFRNIYAKLCSRMMPYYVECDGKKIYFREMLLNKCQKMFEEYTSKTSGGVSKESAFGCIAFIGELYNENVLTSMIIYGCFLSLLMRIVTKAPYAIENICALMTLAGREFLKRDKVHAVLCIDKVKEVMNSTDISKREKFMIMDMMDKFNKTAI